MKKVLLLSLSLILGFCTFAQHRILKNDVQMTTVCDKDAAIGKEASIDNVPFVPQATKSVVANRYDNLSDAETMWTTYDLQSNQYVANRMYQMPNGSVNIVTTMSHQYNQTASDRGTGYNYYNGSYWQSQPNARIESFKTGWPTIAQWGSSGEILISHGNGGLQCYTRSAAGQGSWTFKSTLPLCPSGYPYQGESDAYPTWARVVTSGNNHNIIHVVAAIQHTISSDETDIRTVLFRSEDAVNWTISYGPLQGYGYHIGAFSADQYALAANGHNVAILYSGSLTNSVWMFKSTNDGLDWNGRRVWQDPYEGQSLNTVIYTDTLYRPMNGAVVIDNNGVVHVALNTFEMIRTCENEPGYYTLWSGRLSDGILYWNDAQNTPIQSENGNPHDAARLWWAEEGYAGVMHNDSTKWIGFIPMYSGYEWDNDKYYHSGTEYVSRFYGASGHPALSCDPQGNLACAFSAPCVKRLNNNGDYYYRSIYVSYRSASEGYWHQNEDDITNPDNNFTFSDSENIFTNAVSNTTNSGEFWFSFQSDPDIGFYWGSNASQTNASENTIHAVKVTYDFGVTSYTITASANPSNGGTVSGAGTYAQGSTCTLHATANSGYSFVKWTKNGTQVSTNPNYSFTVTGNASYVAHFQQNATNYTVSAMASPTGSGFVEGQGTYAQGSTCTLNATPNTGYEFVKWEANGAFATSNPTYVFQVWDNTNCVAYFEPVVNNYTVTVSANPSNGGTVSGGGTYAQGSTCTLRATANSGYFFVNWTKNGTAVSTNPNYSFTVTDNASYVANFEPVPEEYTITVNADPANGGTVSGGGTYPEGSTCVISAMPNTGYVFENWTINGSEVSTDPTYSFIVSRDAIYVAHFTQSTNHVTITAMAEPVEGGAVSGGGTYELGDNCTLYAIAASGYEFVNWTLNGSIVSTEASFSFPVTSNAVYVAHFNRIVNHYTVTVSLEPTSAGSVIGVGSYEEGTSCTLIAIANLTYTFVSWTENGAVVSTDDHYTFTVERNRNFVAVFSQGQFYTISASAGANGTISPEGDVFVEPGEDKTFAIIPNSGCQVRTVLVDGIDLGPIPSYTFRSVNGNHSIHAEFSGLGVDDVFDLGLNLYPNPANGFIDVEGIEMKEIVIYDLIGTQRRHKDVNGNHVRLETSSLDSGTYILKVTCQDGRSGHLRFVVAR